MFPSVCLVVLVVGCYRSSELKWLSSYGWFAPLSAILVFMVVVFCIDLSFKNVRKMQ